MADGKSLAQKMRENLAALKEQGAPPERIQEEIEYWNGRSAEVSATDPERQPSTLDKAGSAAQSFVDAATGGLAGLATDALSSGDFAENRRIRSAGKAALNPALRTALEVGGALAMPIPGGALLRAGKGAGRLARLGASAGDAAAQAGVSGAISNINDTSISGLKEAGKRGLQSAMMGAAVAPVLSGAAGLVARGAGRVKGLARLDKTAFKAKDELANLDAVNYGNALEQVAEPLSPKMRGILGDKDIAPAVRRLREMRQWRDVPVNDPKFLDAVYKEALSDWGVQIEKAAANADPSKPNLIRSTKDHIGLLKRDFLDAMDTQVPGYRTAVKEHAVGQGEIDALLEGADVGKRVGADRPVNKKKVFTESREAFLRSIPKMTKEQAEMALYGVLGRTSESVHITGSPLGLFGLMSSAVRLPLQMYRTGPIVKALEEKIGREYGDKRLSDVIRGTVSRTIGQENQP